MGENVRDWLRVGSEVQKPGRVLTKTPHEIGVIVTHQQIAYGSIIERDQYVLKLLKQTIFRAVRDTIAEHSVSSRVPKED